MIELKVLDDLVERVLVSPAYRFDLGHEPPAESGLYAIYRIDTGQHLHAGKSDVGLLHRLTDHFGCGGIKARSDLVQKVQDRGYAANKREAQDWIRQHCSFQYLAVLDYDLRFWGEHRLLGVLQPIWCIKQPR